MQLWKIDEQGFYVFGEEIQIDDDMKIPLDYTSIKPEIIPEVGMFKPRLVNGVVVETANKEEMDAIINKPSELSPLEQLQKDQAELMFDLIMKGVI